MNFLFANRSICFSNFQFPPPDNIYHHHSSLFHRQNLNLPICYQTRWLPKTSRFCSVGDYNQTTNSVRYGGWDDNGLVSDSNQFRNFLVSVGIDHKRHFFTFIFGFLCALAISRVKVSSIAVFPASVFIFAVGFSIGFVRGGSVDEFNLLENRNNRGKVEISGVYIDNLRNLVEFFDGVAIKLDNLKCSIQNAIDSREITLGDLESYIKVLESNDLSTSNARKVVEGLVNNGGNSKGVNLENHHKPSRKIKDIGDVGFEVLQSFGSLLGGKLVGSKPNKVRNNAKPQMPINPVGNRSSIPSEVNADYIDSATNSNPAINLDAFEELRKKQDMEMDYFTSINITRERDRINLKGMHGSSKRFIDDEEHGYENNRLQYRDNYLNSSNSGRSNKLENSRFNDNFLDPGDYSFKMKHREARTSFVEERGFEKTNGAYRSSHMSKSESEIYKAQFREDGASKNENSHLTDQPFGEENELASSSSSIIYDDAMFSKYLMEANDLLKQARDLMKYRRDEEQVEVILHQSASLLAKATTMKPMSLLAVGQLGNTYLLHGELKLRMSRELRKLLAGKEPASVGKWVEMAEGLNDSINRRDKVTSILISVCEECEELLVMAGRRYRMALSIDRNDVRALYNWGLALSFRAQLIADVGPEAAFDADKVFLAAIDKFDAMMSRGNIYAPDALFRWAMILQQRSRLRPNNSKEKAKLLLQAKRLYEDSLNMNSDNVQVREALMSCTSELQFGQY